MILTTEQKCLLWLSAAETGAKHVGALMNKYKSAQGIWDSFPASGTSDFYPAVRAKLAATHSRDAIDGMCERLEKLNVHLLFADDENYPPLLKAIDDYPYLLYYAGRLSSLNRRRVAVVGTRTPSSYGRDMARSIARELCENGFCVVSGLAMGIDRAAHEGALEAGGCTVGVLGSGINNPYPAEHRGLLRKIAGGTGLIISEYPLDSEPIAYHFPHRNRIISGLSEGVVFVEGKIKSGGMHTVTSALEQGRDVFAVPGRVGSSYSEGPHTILREGARLVTCARDILEDMGEQPAIDEEKEAPNAELSPVEAEIIAALETEPMTVEELSEKINQSMDELVTELGTMEIMGLVNREAGNRFAVPVSRRHQRRN